MIVKVPRGEAPEEVRREWIGLILPCIGKFDSRSEGVLTGQQFPREILYHVR